MRRALQTAGVLGVVLLCAALGATAQVRSQSFSTWPTTSDATPTFTHSTHQGWEATNTHVSGKVVFPFPPVVLIPAPNTEPKAAWLRDTGTSWILSPLLTNGVGTISFAYRTREGANYSFVVETSPDTSTWTTRASQVPRWSG